MHERLRGFASILIFVVIGIALAIFVFLFYFKNHSSSLPKNETACTLEAKICPDGSSVGRTGPNCEFAPCPSEAETGPDATAFPESFDATFEIYTNGTQRIFSAAMYRNQSEDAYVDNAENIVHVKNPGITWQEFFDTLPFSLDESCLTTGTGQTFCNGENKKLKFYLNDDEAPNALSLPIEPDDSLVVRFE